MCEKNQTKVTEFHLLGFKDLEKVKSLLFIALLLIYAAIIGGNLLIILLVSISNHLKIPMFFFLKHLAIADVLLTTSIVPLMLNIMLKAEGAISVSGCIFQLYLFGVFGFVQCLLIAIMSYDRYLAVCNPLHYTLIMRPKRCQGLVFGSWTFIVIGMLSEISLVGQFDFCGLNNIDHFFCDIGPIVELSNSDPSVLKLEDFIFSILVICLPFAFIIVTYIYIFITILKISSTTGRKKAFSTCSSHLTTVCIYYGTLIAVYMMPSNESASLLNKYISLLYIMGTPLTNPMIYSLRNHEIQKAMKTMLKNILSAICDIHLSEI
ncbi:olfactory receptor 11A1-like [Pseudophryne corroboree]|uniref:olfactory receptor 11A1-like n=1 Tax=Pseudophryne corroboree TaxID=495146 RepID=UPI0030815D6A